MLQTEQEHLIHLCQWYVSLCVDIGTFPCKVIAFLNPGQKTMQGWHEHVNSKTHLKVMKTSLFPTGILTVWPSSIPAGTGTDTWYCNFFTLLVKWGRLRPSFYGWLDHGLYSQNKDSCSMFPCPGTAWLRSWSDMNHQHHFHAWDMPSNLQVLLIMKGPVDTVSIPVPLQPGHLEGHIIKRLSNCFPVN